jgi:hypothetical protein
MPAFRSAGNIGDKYTNAQYSGVFYENMEISIADGLCENLKSVKYPLFEAGAVSSKFGLERLCLPEV